MSSKFASIIANCWTYIPARDNLVAKARDPPWEESWGSGKKPKRMHRIHCIPLLSDPVHLASAQYLSFLTMEPLQGVENDIT